MLLFPVFLNNFFADFALCGVAEALNGVGSCLVPRDHLFAVWALDIVLTLFILATVLHRHELLLSTKYFGVALGIHVEDLDFIFNGSILTDASTSLRLVTLL